MVYAAFKGSGNNYQNMSIVKKHSNLPEFLDVHHVRASTSQSKTNAVFDLFFIPNTLALKESLDFVSKLITAASTNKP